MGKLQGQSTSCPNSIAQVAACEALTGDQSSVLEMKQAFHVRREIIVNRLNEMEQISCATPYGAFYVFPNIKKLINRNLDGKIIKSALDLCMILLEKKSVVSVAGDSFGSNHNIRFSYATSEPIINEAMNRFEELLKDIE
jgi:aspartate aminotransferase